MIKKISVSVLLVLLFAVLAAIALQIFDTQEGQITFLDHPKNLSNNTETIELKYIDWGCACANWLPTATANALDNAQMANNCIFIEAQNQNVKILEKDKKNSTVKLTGRFYKDKGISRDYIKQTSEKPKPAKVFKYTAVQVLK